MRVGFDGDLEVLKFWREVLRALDPLFLDDRGPTHGVAPAVASGLRADRDRRGVTGSFD
jgi:hypothetical protein